jgi:hypothetical protein
MTPLQHMEALGKANETRLARGSVRHALYEGRMSIADALDEECCQSMPVFDLLAAQYRWGAGRVQGVMRSIPVGFYRKVCDLTDRQRGALVRACSPKEKGGTR